MLFVYIFVGYSNIFYKNTSFLTSNLFISHNIILCNYLHHYNHKNDADNTSTICVISLMSS